LGSTQREASKERGLYILKEKSRNVIDWESIDENQSESKLDAEKDNNYRDICSI
jgi:hypothetical protein